MAEEYRQKYLDLERDYIFLKNGHDYEIQKARGAVNEAERRFNEKLNFEIGEADRRLRESLQNKDF